MNLVFYHKKKDGTEVPFFQTPISPLLVSYLERNMSIKCNVPSFVGTIDWLDAVCTGEQRAYIPFKCDYVEIDPKYLGEFYHPDDLDPSDLYDEDRELIDLSIRQHASDCFSSLLLWIRNAVTLLHDNNPDYLGYKDLYQDLPYYNDTIKYDDEPMITIKWHHALELDVTEDEKNDFIESEYFDDYFNFGGWLYSLDEKVPFFKLEESD